MSERAGPVAPQRAATIAVHKPITTAQGAGRPVSAGAAGFALFQGRQRRKGVCGRVVRHPGRINWRHSPGVIEGTVVSPKRSGNEWQIFSALIGRLAQRYAGSISGIMVQFPEEPEPPARKRRKRPGRR